jgi:hypothetical protein
MSEEVVEEEAAPPVGAPPVSIQLTGEAFLKPTTAPKSEARNNYYLLSPLLPLGAFSKGHELFLIGNAWLKSWTLRIFAKSNSKKEDLKMKTTARSSKEKESEEILKEEDLKMRAMELLNCVIGQTSRGLGRGTEQALLKRTVELIEKRGEKKSIWDKLFGR